MLAGSHSYLVVAASPRDLSAPQICPHCIALLRITSRMWRHKQRCAENPDAPCRWCGLKYERRRIRGHEWRCPRNAEKLLAEQRGRPRRQEVPQERWTGTDWLVYPLAAGPLELRPLISEMRRDPTGVPKTSSRFGARNSARRTNSSCRSRQVFGGMRAQMRSARRLLPPDHLIGDLTRPRSAPVGEASMRGRAYGRSRWLAGKRLDSDSRDAERTRPSRP
jgi:hypothetical protein